MPGIHHQVEKCKSVESNARHILRLHSTKKTKLRDLVYATLQNVSPFFMCMLRKFA